MAQQTFPALETAEVAEVAQHLIDRGWQPGFSCYRDEDGLLHIDAPHVTDAALTAAMDAYVQVSAPGEWVQPEPPLLRGHVEHIVSLAKMTDLQLAQVTDAAFRHAVRDLARAFVLNVRRDWDDPG